MTEWDADVYYLPQWSPPVNGGSTARKFRAV